MKCPTPCDRCGEVVELDQLKFRVDCGCEDECTHGICAECREEDECQAS